MICDGKTIYSKDAGRVKTHPARVDDALKLQGFLARVGVSLAGMLIAEMIPVEPPKDQGPFDLDKEVRISEFKAGAKDQVGQKQAQTFEFMVRAGRRLNNVKVVTWIDLQNELPLKRTIEIEMDRMKMRWMETYTTFSIGTEIDAKLFEIPK